jgi:hypothetical protein
MCSQQDRGRKMRQLDSLMTSLNDLSERGRMTWAAQEEDWTGRPEEVLDALANRRPADETWEGVNPDTKSVASSAWQLRPASQLPTEFIEIDGDTITSPARTPGDHGAAVRCTNGIVRLPASALTRTTSSARRWLQQ